MKRVVGLLGGMGPAATVDLFARIVQATPARKDQDHLHILIDNNPAVPDRTAAILRGGADPLPALLAGLQRLETQGAELLAMPCNTAHHYLPALQDAAAGRFLDMIAETARALRAACGADAVVGILATEGTLACGLYQNACRAAGLEPMTPDAGGVQTVMEAVYGAEGIKAGGPEAVARAQLQQVCADLERRGAQAILLGCTELPLALRAEDLALPLIASNQALAEAVVREALI